MMKGWEYRKERQKKIDENGNKTRKRRRKVNKRQQGLGRLKEAKKETEKETYLLVP